MIPEWLRTEVQKISNCYEWFDIVEESASKDEIVFALRFKGPPIPPQEKKEIAAILKSAARLRGQDVRSVKIERRRNVASLRIRLARGSS